MSLLLKQSTAITIQLGPFLDKTDGVTEETLLTLDVELSKNGAVFGNRSSAGAIAHDVNGWYRVPLDSTDTATLGILTVKSHDAANALPVWQQYMVVPANVWDSFFGTDRLQVDLRELGDANLALTTQMKADVNAEVDSALDTAIPGSPTADSVNERIKTMDGLVDVAISTRLATSGYTTPPTVAAIADGVWDEVASGHDTAGSMGNLLNGASTLGAGAISWTYTLTSSVDASAIADADIWVTSDLAGTTVIASGRTNASGQVTFYLDAGTVYIWCQKSGYNFSNPDSEVVS